MDSLEYNIEALGMALVAPEQAGAGRLDNIPSRHHERTDSAAIDALIFKAEAGAHELDGLKLRPVNLTITYASQTATPAQADERAAAMIETIYDRPNWPELDLDELYYVILEDGSETKRDDGNKTRQRIVTIPFRAKLAAAA